MKILVAALLLTHLVNAQHKWNEGVIVLNDNQVIKATISVAHDVLLVQENDQVSVFPSHKISSFRFYDSLSDINRHYVSLMNDKNFFRTHYFYEVVVWGNTSVLRREHHIIYNKNVNANKDAAYFDYFVFLDQDLIPLKKFRAKAYPRLQSLCAFPLAEWVTREKLNPNRQADAIRIIQLSNKNPYDISIAGL